MKRWAYITDIHLDEEYTNNQGVDARDRFRSILQDVRRQKIKDIIIGGDVGEKESLSWFFSQLQDFKVDISPGNHDSPPAVAQHFHVAPINNELYYSSEVEGLKALFMDSSSARLSEAQLAWFSMALQTAQPLLVFIHHPVLPVDTVVDRLYPLQNRDRVATLLEEQKVPVYIFCGHYHLPDFQVRGNIKQAVSPSASFGIERYHEPLVIDPASFGYRIIEADGEKVKSHVLFFSEGRFVPSVSFNW
jgi:Icc protein